MKARAASLAVAIAAGAVLPLMPRAIARDHGVMGQTWPVIEPDLLATIEGRLRRLEANGGLERMQQELAAKTRERVMHPAPVAGLSPAIRPRKWLHDPSIIVENDVRDHRGNLIAARGTRVNPLAIINLKRALVFVDGDSDEQLQWATSRYKVTEAKIIFVSGSPLEKMKQYQRRFFFDQRGELTARFAIEHTPAIVAAAGEQLAVEEVVLGKGRS